jgi:chorismate mutase/prephenate dehydratase
MVKIATLGPEGSFSEEAAVKYGLRTGERPEIILLDDPEQILGLEGGSDLGLVAIENSLEGSIGHTLDLMREMGTSIRDEVVLEIRHFLLGRKGAKIERIMSHPAALSQCRRFLRENYPDCELVATSSTAQGAMRAATEAGSVGIASSRSAEIYGLEVLTPDIQDRESYTRFVVVGHGISEPTGRDKTSLIFLVKDIPGALHRALAPFAKRGINLTKIESRPSRRVLGEYVFFVDLLGHASVDEVKDALEELNEVCTFLKVLGSYPATTFPEPR